MEQKPLPIGIDNFEMLITRGYYFVDKTLLIKDLLDNKASVNLCFDIILKIEEMNLLERR